MCPAGKRFRASCPWSAAQGRAGSLHLGRRPGQRCPVTGERRCLGGHPRCPVQQLSCCRAASSTWFQVAFSALECHPNRSSRVLGWGCSPSSSAGRHQQPRGLCQLCRWRQTQLGTRAAASSNQTQQGISGHFFPSPCRVLLASVRWQLPAPRMRKQGPWRQVRQQSTSPGPGGSCGFGSWQALCCGFNLGCGAGEGGWGAGFSGRGRGLGFSWMPGVDGGRH